MPHEDWGTAIVACVVACRGQTLTESEIKRHVAKLLPRYMVPGRAKVLDRLPRTSTGKVDRQALAQTVAEEELATQGSPTPQA